MRVTVTSRGGYVAGRMRGGAERGVVKAAEHVLGVSQGVVPLDEATLQRSGRVDADGLVAAVSYGGDDETLGIVAIVQHELLEYRHAPGRTAKYLETPLNTEADTVRDIVAAEVRRALK